MAVAGPRCNHYELQSFGPSMALVSWVRLPLHHHQTALVSNQFSLNHNFEFGQSGC